MKVIVENSAKMCIHNIFLNNCNYSINNAIKVDMNINQYLEKLNYFSYIGRYIPEINDKRFKEVIYRRNRKEGYRIMYYISKKKNIVYVFYVINCKQDFNLVLKQNDFYNKYHNF
ncbi:MAG: hypothetical protein IJ809_07035 [Clostridia bacterium]|nr:hypothetical protein [Clostridia bacterium]